MQVPSDLYKLQQWFAKAITTPLNLEIAESERYIAAPSERIKIYQEQYWFRLISAMQENFPTLTALFGHHDFNHVLAIPYLSQKPSRHWSINHLGMDLPAWIEAHYEAPDKLLVYHAASLDSAFVELFLAPPSTLRTFKLPFNLFSFRTELLKRPPEYWLGNDFPLLEKGREYYFVLYRNKNNLMNYREVKG